MIEASTIAYAEDLFSGLGPVTVRRMFGGAGLYLRGVMFALIDDDRIFLKTDDALREALKDAGAVGWIYTGRKGPQAWPQETSYWSLPGPAEDDPEEACAWARRALAVAETIKAARPVRRRRSHGA